MRAGRRLAASLATGLWLAVVMLAHGQDGVTRPSVASVLEAATNLPQILERFSAPESGEGLRKAVETERLRLVGILRNDGYLAAEIALEWPDIAVADAPPVRVRVDPGPAYVLGAIDVATTRPLAAELVSELHATAAPSVGDNASAAALGSLSSRLTWTLGRNGYPFARVDSVDVEPEPGLQSAKVVVRIDAGELARFVDADFTRVDPALQDKVASLIPFAAGDLYSVESLATLRQNLAGLAGADGARVDVVAVGDDGFRLALRAKRAHQLLPDTLISSLGFGLLIAALGIIAARQAAVSAGAGKVAVRSLSVAMGGVLLLAGCLLALRVFSFI